MIILVNLGEKVGRMDLWGLSFWSDGHIIKQVKELWRDVMSRGKFDPDMAIF
jgi:hypothetical protein